MIESEKLDKYSQRLTLAMVDDSSEEKYFREQYSKHIQTLKDDELEDERKRFTHQSLKTPGRRGEQIKHEEIDREIIRRVFNKDKSRED